MIDSKRRLFFDFAGAVVIGTAVAIDHGGLLGLFIGLAFWSIDLAFVGQQLAHQRITDLEKRQTLLELATMEDGDESEEGTPE